MSIFPAKILLATDGSADADLALSTAVDLVNSTGSDLHLVTAAPGVPDPVYAMHEVSFRYETYEDVMEAIRSDAQHILDEQAEKVERAGGAWLGRISRPTNDGTRRSYTSPTRSRLA